MDNIRKVFLPVVLLLSFSTPAADLTQQDQEECLALGQIAGSVVVFKSQGVPREQLWSKYAERGVDIHLRPTIEALAEIAYSPDIGDADAGDFIKYVVQACLSERESQDETT